MTSHDNSEFDERITYSATCEVCMSEGESVTKLLGKPVEDESWKQCVGMLAWHFSQHHPEVRLSLKGISSEIHTGTPSGPLREGDATMYLFRKNIYRRI